MLLLMMMMLMLMLLLCAVVCIEPQGIVVRRPCVH